MDLIFRLTLSFLFLFIHCEKEEPKILKSNDSIDENKLGKVKDYRHNYKYENCPESPPNRPKWYLEKFDINTFKKKYEQKYYTKINKGIKEIEISYSWIRKKFFESSCSYNFTIKYIKLQYNHGYHLDAYYIDDRKLIVDPITISNSIEKTYINPDTEEEEEGEVVFGKSYKFYPNGNIREILCLSTEPISRCGKRLIFNKSGKLIKEEDTKRECDMGCGEFLPFRFPGKHYVMVDSLDIHSKPDFNSSIVYSLKKDDEVIVIEDTGKIVEKFPDVSVWALVTDSEGKKGYAFGAYLRSEDEYWRKY